MTQLHEWLLEGPDWMEYRLRMDMLKQPDDAPEVIAARKKLNEHPSIQALKIDIKEWSQTPLVRHNDAKHPIHKLSFLAALGLTTDDPEMREIVELVKANVSAESVPQVLVNIPKHFGGTGKNAFQWMLCDAPLALYCLIKLEGEPAISEYTPGIEHLISLVRENGFPCAAAPELGKFRGPGRKTDPCPYANLLMLKLLAELPEYKDSDAAKLAVESLLSLWTDRKERKPYLFAMGTHFNRLKAPLIWFDILHVLDVLSRFEWTLTDSRYLEMLSLLQERAGEDGQLTPESIWMAWKGWSFGQKKTPDPWITFLSQQILNR